MTIGNIHHRILRLDSFKELRRRFAERPLREIKRFIAISRKGHIYLANMYFVKNVVIIDQKKYFKIFKLFKQSLTLEMLLNELQRLVSLNYAHPDAASVEKADATFKMVLLLIKKQFVVPADFDENRQLKKYRAKAFFEKKLSRAVWIIPSTGCNFCCPGCPIYSGETTNITPSLMTPKSFDHQWKFILKQLPKKRKNHIAFTFFGGEPLLNKPLVQHAARRILAAFRAGKLGSANATLAIVTNGTLIDAASARMLKKCHVDVIISLDGIESSHDAQRMFKGRRGTFDAVMRGASVLKKIGVPYTFSWTIGPKNIDIVPHDLKLLVKKFEKPTIYFNIMMGSKDSSSPFGDMTKASFFNKLHRVFDTARTLGLQDKKLSRYMKWNLAGSYPAWFECAAVGGGSFALRPDGKIGMCPAEFLSAAHHFRYPEEIGDINKDALFQQWRGRTSLAIPECYERCAYVTYCAGGCPHRVEQVAGDIRAVAKEICRIQQFYIERGIIEVCEAI